MPLCKHIIIALSLATCLAPVSCSKQEDKLTPAEYQLMIEQSVLSGDLSLVEEIPVGIYGDKEVVEILDTKTGELKKVIRDRSKYAKNSPLEGGGQRPEDVSNPKSPNTEHRIPNTNSVSSSVESVSNPKSQIENPKSDAASNTNSSNKSVGSGASGESSIDPDLQQAMLEMSVQSNDLVVLFDKNVTGIITNGNRITVGPDKLNSDLFEGSYSNAAGIWLAGLNKDQLESLSMDYGKRMFSIPGVGQYILRECVAPDSKDFYKEKVDILSEALTLNPDNYNLRQSLAKTYAENLGNLDKALAVLNTSTDSNSSHDYNKGLAYDLAAKHPNNYKQAEQYRIEAQVLYEKAQNSHDPYTVVNATLNLSKLRKDNLDEYVSILETGYQSIAYKDRPKLISSITRKIGEEYYHDQNYQKAIEWYEKTPSKNLWDLLKNGNAYEKVGNQSAAINAYKDGARKFKNYPDASIKLGNLYGQHGNITGIKNQYKKVNSILNNMTTIRRQKYKSTPEYQKLRQAYKNIK